MEKWEEKVTMGRGVINGRGRGRELAISTPSEGEGALGPADARASDAFWVEFRRGQEGGMEGHGASWVGGR